MSETTISPSSGQTWRSKSTDTTTLIHGRRMNLIVHLAQYEHGYVETPLNEFMREYEFISCDHEAACCKSHREHTTPHKACILR